jgi:hypothetical protein
MIPRLITTGVLAAIAGAAMAVAISSSPSFAFTLSSPSVLPPILLPSLLLPPLLLSTVLTSRVGLATDVCAVVLTEDVFQAALTVRTS